jgi:hypothetical protein
VVYVLLLSTMITLYSCAKVAGRHRAGDGSAAHGLRRRLAAQYVAIQARSQWVVPELRLELSDTAPRWCIVGGQRLERTTPG